TEAWEFVIAGGAIYDNLDYSFTAGTPSGTLIEYKSPGSGSPQLRYQLRVLRDFMNDLDFIHIKPMNGIVKGGSATAALSGTAAKSGVTVRVLGEEGKAYAIYVRGGRQVELELRLAAGKYRAEWVRTTGGVIKSQEVEGG